jgi:hypothetical protein
MEGLAMQNVSILYHTLGNHFVQLLSFLDLRNFSVFLWMIIAAILSQNVTLTAWDIALAFDVYAASTQTRFRRWLHNPKINTQKICEVLIRHALLNWDTRIILALDTSMLRDEFCMIRVCAIYMGRAFPIAWRVLKHKSSSVKFEEYQEVLEQARGRLPMGIEVFFLADRGFASKKLMKLLNGWRWNWRIRIKENQVLRCQGKKMRPRALGLKKGEAMLFGGVIKFGKDLRRLNLSAGWSKYSNEPWYILSNGTVSIEHFMEYAQRFDIEELFRDEKSGGFNLEKSGLKEEEALERLILIIAIATLVILHEGLGVIEEGKVKEVDGHRRRGLSCFQIGWRWILKQLRKAVSILKCRIDLRPATDPLPVAPTRKESIKRYRRKNPKWHFRNVVQCTTLP